jgi:uncharacterized protein YecE (DUF72 family)
MPEIRVGISGWTYPPWRGNFYPDGLSQKNELAYASRRFNALEINGTFYSLQKASSFRAWRDDTPPGFVFSLKGGKYLTHVRQLKDPRKPLANFFSSGLLALREKLGPILWQFAPTMKFDEERFKEFFELLPHDTVAMAKLAQEHDAFMVGKTELETDAKRPVRHAVEFRHESFCTERFTDLCRAHNVALVVADVASKFPTAQDVTADWVYIRLHGSRELYKSGYEADEISAWAAKVRAWSQGAEPADARKISGKPPPTSGERDVYVFFDNTDVKQRAPVDARQMAEALGVAPPGSEADVLGQLGGKPKAAKSRTPAAKAPAAEKAAGTKKAPRAKKSASKPGVEASTLESKTAWKRPAKKSGKST